MMQAADGTRFWVDKSKVPLTDARGQSMALIQVTPKATANLAGGMETVRLAVRADAAYLVEPGASSAQVSIIERLDTFQTWLAREFPGAGDLEPSDTLGSAIPLIQRYAYGLDPDQPDPAGLPRLADGRTVRWFSRSASRWVCRVSPTGSARLVIS